MSNILQDHSSSALVTAIEANWFELFQQFEHWNQAEVHVDPEMLWTLTDIPFPLFNGIFNARLAPENIDAAIERVIARGRAKNVPLLWWTGPTTLPTNLGEHLVAHGFVDEGGPTGMAVDLLALNENAPMPAGLTITRVNDVEMLTQQCRTCILGFGMPDYVIDHFVNIFTAVGLDPQSPMSHYIAWLEGKPVSASALFLGAGVAGIFNVATLPHARGRGIGAAITLAGLRDARAMGYRIGVLQASKMGLPVYRQLGFQEYCKIGNYVWENPK